MGRIWSCQHSCGIFCHMLRSSHASPHHPLHPTHLISCMSFSFLLIHLLLPVYAPPISSFSFLFSFPPPLPHTVTFAFTILSFTDCFFFFIFHPWPLLFPCSFISFLGWISTQIDWQPDGDTRKRDLGMTSSKGSSLSWLLAAARTLLSLIFFSSPCTPIFFFQNFSLNPQLFFLYFSQLCISSCQFISSFQSFHVLSSPLFFSLLQSFFFSLLRLSDGSVVQANKQAQEDSWEWKGEQDVEAS